jgi:hypothetical protein
LERRRLHLGDFPCAGFLSPPVAAFGWVAITSFLAGSVLFASGSSSRPITIPDLHNTGVNDEQAALAAFVLDKHYSLRLPGGRTSPVQTMVYPGVANNRLGRWLIPTRPLYGRKAIGDYVWTTQFTMPKDADPKGAVITGRWAADSTGRDILVNGKSSGQTASGPFAWSDFTLSGPFQSGRNILQLVVHNGGTGPDALRVEFTGASAPPATSSPSATPMDSNPPGGTAWLAAVPSSQTVVAGSPATIWVQYSASANLQDSWDYVVTLTWGDSRSNTTIANSSPGFNSASHTYSAAGNYTVGVSVAAYDQTNPANNQGASTTVQVSVVNDPSQLPSMPTVQFSQANYAVNEDAGTAAITVNLSAASQQQVVVGYATSAGTATTGTNYQDRSGYLVFSPGETQQTFYVKVMNDGRDAPNYTVNLSLSNPVNATLGNPSMAVLTIADVNPTPTVQFNSAAYKATEGLPVVRLPVLLRAFGKNESKGASKNVFGRLARLLLGSADESWT